MTIAAARVISAGGAGYCAAPTTSTAPSDPHLMRWRGGGVQTDRRHERPPADRVPPEQAIARLDLRQIALVALYDGLDGLDRQRHAAEHRAAAAAADAALADDATRHDRVTRRGRPGVLRALLRLPEPRPGRAVLRRGRAAAEGDRVARGPRRHPLGRVRAGRVPRPAVGSHLRRGPQGPGGLALRAGPVAALGAAVGRPADRRTPPPAHRRPDDRRRVRARPARRLGHRAPPAPARRAEHGRGARTSTACWSNGTWPPSSA